MGGRGLKRESGDKDEGILQCAPPRESGLGPLSVSGFHTRGRLEPPPEQCPGEKWWTWCGEGQAPQSPTEPWWCQAACGQANTTVRAWGMPLTERRGRTTSAVPTTPFLSRCAGTAFWARPRGLHPRGMGVRGVPVLPGNAGVCAPHCPCGRNFRRPWYATAFVLLLHPIPSVPYCVPCALLCVPCALLCVPCAPLCVPRALLCVPWVRPPFWLGRRAVVPGSRYSNVPVVFR